MFDDVCLNSLNQHKLYGKQQPSRNFCTKNEKSSGGPFDHSDQTTNTDAKSCMEGGCPLRQRTTLSYICLLLELTFGQYEVFLRRVFYNIYQKYEGQPHTART